jgi:acetyl-CoA carboxylase, biotin carboxylase subunit
MFKRLLIANRGEVAVRIARTARLLGAAPIGVASTADLGASWLDVMDEVVCIGGSAPRDSYLNRDAVLQAARQTGCSALHPGWGFLAEDARFAAMCEQQGITFVGPTPGAMEEMGLKWPAKQAMRAAGLQVIPGSEGLLADADEAARAANECGYPVILKADAGGGGRGMRLCQNEGELREAFPQAAAESLAAFGNGALYLERYLTGGRHIEVQVLGDGTGGANHLGERECSIQRNHQKLIEESPSPALTPEERAELCIGATMATARIRYRGAGTIEFLRAPDGQLYFMEMNTRLQVEHPVTECVTGVDIVRAQLEIAANYSDALHRQLSTNELFTRHAQIPVNGHAIECRINAEDPERDFQPTPGKLEAFEFGKDAGPGKIRVDTHLKAGDEVPPYYDSLIAKVIAWADTRDQAIETMRRALAASRVEGVKTTIPLHLAVLASEEFQSGNYDTLSIPGWQV